jgi:hypothetical protein
VRSTQQQDQSPHFSSEFRRNHLAVSGLPTFGGSGLIAETNIRPFTAYRSAPAGDRHGTMPAARLPSFLREAGELTCPLGLPAGIMFRKRGPPAYGTGRGSSSQSFARPVPTMPGRDRPRPYVAGPASAPAGPACGPALGPWPLALGPWPLALGPWPPAGYPTGDFATRPASSPISSPCTPQRRAGDIRMPIGHPH